MRIRGHAAKLNKGKSYMPNSIVLYCLSANTVSSVRVNSNATNLSSNELDQRYRNYGPIPRTCFYSMAALETHIARVRGTMLDIKTVYRSFFESQIRHHQVLDDDIYDLILMRGVDADQCALDALLAPPVLSVAPLTPSFGKKMVLNLTRAEGKEILTLFDEFLCLPFARALLGTIFEASVHQKLTRGYVLTIRLMVRLENEPDSATIHQWHARHSPLLGPLEQKHQVTSSYTILLPSLTISTYNYDEELTVLTGYYYLLIGSADIGLDSFLLHKDDRGDDTSTLR